MSQCARHLQAKIRDVISPFERCFLAEDGQGILRGWLSYHAPAVQPVSRRRLHRRFWSLRPEFQAERLELEPLAIWGRPQGPILLCDRAPGWRLQLCDWEGRLQTEIEIPEPERRLEFLPCTLVQGPELYLLGEGEDFTCIYRCTNRLEPYLQVEANEAMAGAWALDDLVYGGWSGRLRWKDRIIELGTPIRKICSMPDCPWVLVQAQVWELVHLPDGRRRTVGPAGAATLIPQGVAWAGPVLRLQDWEGEDLDLQYIPSPIAALEWLPLSQRLAALYENETVRCFQCPSGLQLSQISLVEALPVLPTSHTLPYNFSGVATFHANGRLSRMLSSDGSESLNLSVNHDSGQASYADGEIKQRYYENGTVEQFSAWDDNSLPHPKPFEEWALQWVERIW